ncbi:MAG: valine--tRNA ligase [Chloroflexi bacterium]|nr:valine--tRNA ligase [Chloroflexota bacterium]
MTELADLNRPFDSRGVEARTYEFWERQGYFTPTIEPGKEPFVIVIPPPNVTGALHTGHALTFTIEDILTRWHRMMGEPTLWLPGTDHAALPTNHLLKRQLESEGIAWQTLGREKFVERGWQWKEEYHGRIVRQMKRLGLSVDWSRERFTLDEGLSRAVRAVFVRLYQEGLIYRGDYMGNWCPGCLSVISDLEVVHVEEDGHLWHLRYPVEDDPTRGIVVATTRPETMLGDTAVAVHPDDERYKELIGKTLRLPIMNRLIPVIADDAVDPKFGTGAVKVTPAHDPTDYEIGQRHDLPSIEVMNPDATMSEAAGKYAGLDRFEARKSVLSELEASGALMKTEDYKHSVGHCQRSNDVVEPRISMQWWVRMKPLAEPALAAVRDGQIAIVPDRFVKVWTHWMENIRDWTISRQAWWGHRIPVWYCENCEQVIVQVDAPSTCAKCGADDLLQDPDTLDTWFSSGLWPFSTLGWPDDTEDLRYFYPTSVMETGYDILFFWVARMVMLGIHFMEEPPFRTIYLHGMVRDAFGQKMSKTKGNVIDPLDLMDEYGTDALRLSMVTGNSAGNDLRLSEQKVEHGRNFANKLWQGARFALNYEASATGEGQPSALPERWIRHRAASTAAQVSRLLENFQLGEAARTIEEFFWGDVCDWYIETVKPRVLKDSGHDSRAIAAARVLEDVLSISVRLLHPFMPYVTEEIWQHLRARQSDLTETIAIAAWPSGAGTDERAGAEMDLVIEAITAIRNYRAEHRIEARQQLELGIGTGDSGDVLRREAYLLERLGNVRCVADSPSDSGAAARLLVRDAELTIVAGATGDAEQHRSAELARLQQELELAIGECDRARKQLDQPGFRDRAPAEVIARAEQRLASAEERRQTLGRQIEDLA